MARKVEAINYKPPKTIREFMLDHREGELFYDWIIGPVGSGKTTGIFFKLVYMAGLQKPGPDGIRRTRAVIVRNTMPQLKDTTLVSWNYWFRDGQAGKWHATQNRFVLKFGDVECEVLFRALDTPGDVARVLSLEVTFALLDEFVQIPQEIVDALSARLGRFPSSKDGGATNWGMWGSSNPDTEDNWWHDYLHYDLPENASYFLQPSGFSEDAENVEHLPGNQDYYHNQAKGKSKNWIKQFLEAEWGFSASGKPVVPTFQPDMHIAKSPILFEPRSPLIAGFDPGLGGSAFIFGQQDLHGRLRVLGELIQTQMGADRLMRDKCIPYVRSRFPDAELIIAPDPMASNRSNNDEKTIVDNIRKYAKVVIESNNRLPLRINAIEHFTTRLTDVGPALQIDPQHCPTLVRALKGGWRYELDTKRGTIKGAEPEKNKYSHPGDGFGYLARFFHKDFEKQARHHSRQQNRRRIETPYSASYHAR